ncbi:sugar ABC transporter substrate-binding protein [Roseibium salinum]|uniref:sn-glycerol-3-phosphate-binding periplasmic protein UgpB n=2 Tax=Roseibium salinum TaxID=1604349 RepID=A0ABT3QX35_9HYPH|nr:sugar ABC transporter substrate-binding protein [Roseibium sp. DSM 29163]MCX2721497.1 sugar ABC transporter substrate-binding protein [Roseibium sp. DSM 29163]MDN3721973.1 sugar ABC transporter substrate-binding protein [Roseibium salinum]
MQGAANAEDVTLNWALWDWDKVAYYKPLIEAYEASHPGVKIEHTDLGSSDYNQMVMTQLTGGGDNLDIISIKDIPGYAQMVNTGRLMNLTELGAVPEDTSGYGGLIEALTVDGNLYGLPFRTDFWIVYYNKDLFDAAGVEYPTNDMTWAEFDEKARAVTSGFGADKVYGAHLHTWRSTVQLPAIQSGETTLVSKDYSFLKPWYERALKLQEDGVIRSYASLKTSQTHYSGPWFSSQIAMLPMGSWFIGTQIDKVKSGESTATNWGMVKYPHPEGVEAGATAGQVTSLGINVNSKKADAAKDFIEWVSGPEGAAIVSETGTIPALRDENVIKTITAKEGFPSDPESAQALVTSAAYLEMPVDLQAAQYELVLNRVHDELMTNNISIDDAIAEMNAGVADIK